MYCIGVNEEATRLSGIRTRLIRIQRICDIRRPQRQEESACVRVRSASPTQGIGYELDAIAVVLEAAGWAAAREVFENSDGRCDYGCSDNALNVSRCNCLSAENYKRRHHTGSGSDGSAQRKG